jgi:hypothetical protein
MNHSQVCAKYDLNISLSILKSSKYSEDIFIINSQVKSHYDKDTFIIPVEVGHEKLISILK